MESTMLIANLDEKVNPIDVDVNIGQHVKLEKFETPDNSSIIKAKIEEALKLIWKEDQRRAEIDEVLTERNRDLECSMDKLRYTGYGFGNQAIKFEKLQETINKWHHFITNKGTNIKRLGHQMHGCSNLKEERQILKEIQQLEENTISEENLNLLQRQFRYLGLGTLSNPNKTLRQRIEEDYNELQSLATIIGQRIREQEMIKKEAEKARKDIGLYREKIEKINRSKAKLYGNILGLKKQLGKNCNFQACITYP